MNIKDSVYEIIEKYDGSGNIEDCVGDIKELFETLPNIKTHTIWSNTDVFDSCGLGIFYIAVAWVDESGELHICGDRLTSC